MDGSPSETRHFYYNTSWQLLEERLESGGEISAYANRQNLWGLRYIDDLILRDRDTNADGTLDERLYCLQDPNWNVIAIAGTDGAVVERYSYTAYGTPTFLTSTFTARDPNTSSYSWSTLYTSRQYDPETGLQHSRNRYLHLDPSQVKMFSTHQGNRIKQGFFANSDSVHVLHFK